MADDTIRSYAAAMYAVAQAERDVSTVEDELFRFSRALQGSDDLRAALADSSVPTARRSQIVEDLLGGQASSTTVSLVSLVVANGRGRDLPAIIDELVRVSAADRNKEVAEVRSAIELTEDQKTRLAASLGKATGKQVEVKVVIDPSVLGGVVAQVGDTVIDGSVRKRLDQLKNQF